MATVVELVQGWTSPLDYGLAMGTDTSPDLTGMTVTLRVSTVEGVDLSLGGSVALLTATAGTVRYTPATDGTDIIKGTYRTRFKVVDGSGRIAYFPSGEPDTWKVYQP